MSEQKLHEQGIELQVFDRDGIEHWYDSVIDFGPVFDSDGEFKEPLTFRVKTEERPVILFEEPQEITMHMGGE